jgi:hypothetical protein
MSQIVAFPVPPTPYPDLAGDLNKAESVLLVAIRRWVECHPDGEDPMPRLCQSHKTAGAPDAAFSINGLMAIMARAVTRQVEIHCPRCRHLSRDEKHVLGSASLTQAGKSDLAEKVLRTTLLSAQGAEFAIGPLAGPGELFARARRLLSRRPLPVEHRNTGVHMEFWSPPSTEPASGTAR